MMKASREPARDFVDFLNANPTPFHVVNSIRARLEKAGCKHISERDDWSETCKPGGKYYLTRNDQTIVGFAIGEKWKPGNGLSIVGAHTDSPALRVKPVSKATAEGYIQVGVECYGGGRWSTWFDRDLSIAGRAMVKTSRGLESKIIRINKPILRIPHVAIHLDSTGNTDWKFNKETDLYPIAGLVAAELNRTSTEFEKIPKDEKAFAPLRPLSERHHPYIMEVIAHEANVNVEAIVDFEMLLYDTHASCIGGLNDELILSGRLDNQGMSYSATEGFINSLQASDALKNEASLRVMVCFHNEEIGSMSSSGAASNLMQVLIRRFAVLEPAGVKPSTTAYEQSLVKSFLLSADMAHAVHPNYSSKYEKNARPEMNKGPVIKINAQNRYATDSSGIAMLEAFAAKANVPLQTFVVRNDSPCGSTIGPMLSAALGMRTLDLGNPQLSMHSIRETGGVYDVDYATKLFESFYEHFTAQEATIMVDRGKI